MIIDSIDGLSQELVADVVIAGAGTVALFMAQFLVRSGLRVALVEAGDRVPVTAQDGLGAESVGKSHDGVRFGRAVGLGGTSALWGGQLAEFVEADLQRDGCEWPISYAELQALYQRCYAELGLPARAPDATYRQELGITLSDSVLEHFFTTWLPQPNFAVLFGKLLRDSDLLRVYLNHTVCGIGFDNGRCAWLEADCATGGKTRFKAGQVVLALGTIGNAQFCLSTQAEAPWRQNAAVGAYFQDHLGGKIADVEVINESAFRRAFENALSAGQKLQPKIRFPTAGTDNPAIGICGMFAFRSLHSSQIAQVKHLLKSLRNGMFHAELLQLPASLWRVGSTLWPVVLRYLRDHRIRALFDEGLDFAIQAEQIPVAHSRVVVRSAQRLSSGLLPVAVDWQLHGSEATAIRDFAARAQRFVEAEGLARLHLSRTMQGDDQVLLDSLADTYHQSGGLRMSASAATGVTDSVGKIWGTDNVYVAGASILPSSSYANCTLTALALSLRSADNILHAMRT